MSCYKKDDGWGAVGKEGRKATQTRIDRDQGEENKKYTKMLASVPLSGKIRTNLKIFL